MLRRRFPELDRQSLGIVDADEATVLGLPFRPPLDGDARRFQLRYQRVQLRDAEMSMKGWSAGK
jgi:hypothetical protein